jgi:hypothetical protein
MLLSWLFIPLLSHLSMNQASTWSLRTSRAHPRRCSYSDLGNSTATSIAGSTPPHPSQNGGGHQQEERSRHPDRRSLGPHPSPPHRPHLVQLQVCVTPGTTSSLNQSTIRSCPSLSPDSCMATRNANVDSLASPMKNPPFPSCPSLLRI